MARVIINKELEKVVDKKFKKYSIKIFELFYSLEENPHKGKIVGQVGGLLIKELKYENFRFYFITDGYKLRILEQELLTDLLIRFIRMFSTSLASFLSNTIIISISLGMSIVFYCRSKKHYYPGLHN